MIFANGMCGGLLVNRSIGRIFAMPNDANMSQEHRGEQRAQHSEREAAPHRGLVRVELRTVRRVRARLVHGDARRARLLREHGVEDDRRDREAERAAELRGSDA